MTRNEMMDYAKGRIKIHDFDLDTFLWVYDDLDEITTKILIQLALDLLVEIKLEMMDEQEGEEKSEDQRTDGD